MPRLLFTHLDNVPLNQTGRGGIRFDNVDFHCQLAPVARRRRANRKGIKR